MTNDDLEGSLTEKQAHHGTGKEYIKGGRCMYIFSTIAQTVEWCDIARVTIGMLPDVALLEIIHFYVDEASIGAWHTLVQVCQKWRIVVFGTPRRLNLRLHCKSRTPVKEMLDAWPLLPIVVSSDDYKKWGKDNIAEALKHNDRICEVDICDMPRSELEIVLAAMQQPFPALTRLRLRSLAKTAPVVPALFLGGSTPRLRSLHLYHILFPGLPELLLSATHLVHLELWRIPDYTHISPETMITCLSTLTRLERLEIGFKSPPSRLDWRSQVPPPQTPILLPVLTELRFWGFWGYLDDLVAQIDAPLLNKLIIILFHQPIFDIPQLSHFISRTPKLKTQDKARVVFSSCSVFVTLPLIFNGTLELKIISRRADLQLSSMAQVCRSSFIRDFIRTVEHLYIFKDPQPSNIEGSQWLELFHPFTAVKGLYISRELVPRIAPALQELVGERVTEVLPALQTLFLEKTLLSTPTVTQIIDRFVAARELAKHPIAFICCFSLKRHAF